MLGNVETFDFMLVSDAQRHHDAERLEDNQRSYSGPDQRGANALELQHHLAGIAFEQA